MTNAALGLCLSRQTLPLLAMPGESRNRRWTHAWTWPFFHITRLVRPRVAPTPFQVTSDRARCPLWWCFTPTRSVFPALPPRRAPVLSARGCMVKAPHGTRTAHRRFPCHCRRYCTRNSADSIARVGLGAAPFLLLPFPPVLVLLLAGAL